MSPKRMRQFPGRLQPRRASHYKHANFWAVSDLNEPLTPKCQLLARLGPKVPLTGLTPNVPTSQWIATSPSLSFQMYQFPGRLAKMPPTPTASTSGHIATLTILSLQMCLFPGRLAKTPPTSLTPKVPTSRQPPLASHSKCAIPGRLQPRRASHCKVTNAVSQFQWTVNFDDQKHPVFSETVTPKHRGNFQ